MKKLVVLLVVAGLALAIGARAQIAVSANDGKQMRPGDNPPGMRPDTVATINLNQYPPKVLATIRAPASLIGPPNAVAVAPDSSIAIVTCNLKVDPSDPAKLIPARTVSVIDISNPQEPKVIQTAAAGPGASGVSINPAMNLVLVANTSGSISVFTLHHKKLTRVGDVELPQESSPTDVVFSRDGKKAYAVDRRGNRIIILDVTGTKVTNSGQTIVTGASPYGMAISPDGRYAVNTNLGGALTPHEPLRHAASAGRVRRGPRRSGTITLINLQSGQVVDSAVVGLTPEHVDLSPDGKYAEVNVDNGAAFSLDAPNYRTTHGLMLIYGVGGGKLTRIASADTGHWCQGATWNRNSNEVLLQCATERDIEVYKFNGYSLVRDEGATLKFDARPGAIATATTQ